MTEITVVIPAYNEEGRISKVLDPVTEAGFDQVIVVDDGSDDYTYSEASEFEDLTVIRLKENKGKSEALKKGVGRARNSHLMFLDADLKNLQEHHLRKMVDHYTGKEKMVLGVFKGGRTFTDLAMTVSPKLTGQRILPEKVWRKASEKYMDGYGVEIAINLACKELKIPMEKVVLQGVSQIMKEEKRGFLKGLLAKAGMYLQVGFSYLKNLVLVP